MASPFQQRSLVRKLLYLGVIIVLFSGSWIWRRYFLEPQATFIAALEQDQGEVQLDASAMRLGLSGFRGLVTCFFWSSAMDMQKKHEWNKLEVVVRWLTKMQPHFMTPWLFQSWNLAYNVSVECDRVNDKYFYQCRGIELLAEGERQNRDNPDLRHNIGFYTQNKVMQSDETNVERSLYQLSNIPPNERDPSRFYKVGTDGRRTIDMERFEDFCKRHPQLVRRLQFGIPRETKQEDRRQFKCANPEAVVQFLADNRRVPSVYQEVPSEPVGAWTQKPDKLKPIYDRFPLLPPKPGSTSRPELPPGTDPEAWQTVPFDRDALTAEDLPLKDHQDGYTVSRAWFGYAQEPIPPPGNLVAGDNKDVVDRVRQRRPKYMATVLFRHYPARAQSYAAERLQQEGWFDEEGWEIPNWFGDHKVVVGADPNQSSQTAWQSAYAMWDRHGLANHLRFPSPEAETNAHALAEQFAKKYKILIGTPVPSGWEPQGMAPTDQPLLDAFRVVTGYQSYRSMSNFAHHYQRARVEAEAETVNARKLFHRAEALRLTADLGEALAVYEGKPEEGRPGAITLWKKVLLKDGHRDFRRDDFIMEQTYETEIKYLELVNEQLKLRLTRLQPYVPLLPKTSADVFPDWILTKGPYDILLTPEGKEAKEGEKGEPLITEGTIKTVQSRRASGRPVSNKSQGPANPPSQQAPTSTTPSEKGASEKSQ
jgi:hypothetical protein